MVAQSTAAQSNLAVTPSLASAINRHVLKVSPSDSIADVISQISAVEGEQCSVTNTAIASTKARISCALITENDRVVGIITERDIVRLTATQTSTDPSLADIPVSTVMTSPVKTMEASAFQDIFAVLFLFRRYRIRHLPIVDSDERLMGIVTPASIREVLRPANLLKIRRVADVMSKEVVQAPASASVMFLAQVMAENRVSCVVIVDAAMGTDGEVTEGRMPGGEMTGDEVTANQPVGIVTERDIVRFQYLGLNLQKLTAREVMSAPLHLLDPQDSLWAAHEAMQERRVRRLVVSWNWGQGLGIVTQTSLLRVFDPIEMCGIIDSLQQTVRQLKTENDATEIGTEATLGQGREPSSEPSASQPPKTLATALSREPNTLAHPTVLASTSTGKSSVIAPAQTAPENATAQALLVQATECITKTVKSSQLSAEQQAQLQEAMQIIQQTRTLLMRSE